MSFLDRIKKFFNRFSKKEEQFLLPEETSIQFGENASENLGGMQSNKVPAKEELEPLEPLDLPEGEIVPLVDENGVLDATSRVTIEKYKHNLQVLMKQAKEKGKVDKFFTIREDDFFPDDWEWTVLSQNTHLEQCHLPVTLALKEAYALEQMGIETSTDLMGIKCPKFVPPDQINEALSKVDKMTGSVMLPSRFRSTKHFTVNTPLELTGDYNHVESDRDFIIMDTADNFLNSGYGYSISYRDAYLDVSHESLPISEEAVALIKDENYDRVTSDEKIAKQLAERKTIRFKGDTEVAISMLLTEKGALPSRVGMKYATYDAEINDILKNSMQELAEKNDLIFERSHAGNVRKGDGHFSSYFDDKNHDFEVEATAFYDFLREKFPDKGHLIPSSYGFSSTSGQNLVAELGTKPLMEAVEEYNAKAKERVSASLEKFKSERASITPEIHQELVSTVKMLNEFYKDGDSFETLDEKWSTEEIIRQFIQGESLEEQLEAGRKVRELLPVREMGDTTKEAEPAFSMDSVMREATSKEIASEHVTECARALPKLKDQVIEHDISRQTETINNSQKLNEGER